MDPTGYVAAFDSAADAALETLRHRPLVARAMWMASELGDFSLVWHLVGVGRGLTSERRANEAFAFAALIGAESVVVNQLVERAFRRVRPTERGDERFPVRRPSTSSFPSGHASAAFFAATLLTAAHGRRSAPVWFGAATAISASRVFVRIHHASDVVAGAVVGLGLGAAARRFWPDR